MMNQRVDSHKLMLHPERVAKWKSGEKILPINMEICLTGACNHRCTFCCCDYMNYKPDMLDYDKLINNIKTISEPKDGLKSVLLAGTGEPCLYPRFINVVNEIKRIGVDVAVSTNGVLFDKNKIDECMESISWVRFSTSGGTEETYNKIHRGKPGDLQKVFSNLEYASKYKSLHNLKTVLNVQIVMIPENVNEIVPLGKKIKELGADRFIVKAFGWNPPMENKTGEGINKEFFENQDMLKEEFAKLSDGRFEALYRVERIHNIFSNKNYDECYASPFHAFLGADGSVYPCCHLPGIEKYKFGNINKESLFDIFMDNSGRRLQVLHILKEEKLTHCANACKLEEMNKYLHELVFPGDHVNFI